MPRLCVTDARLPGLIREQDFLIHRDQALTMGLTRASISHRLIGPWQVLLPDVYLTHPGEPSRRQMMIAALLYAGPDAAIDDVDACRFHGVRAVNVDENVVHVVVPYGSPTRTRGFVVVRRTTKPISVVRTERLRFLALEPALVATTRRMRDPRRVLAVLSDAVERRLTTHAALTRAHIQGSRRNARMADEALAHLGAGVRAASEGDFRNLAEASLVLPQLIYNCLLRLPGGELISPDALAVDAALVHETNGRIAHARSDLFEDMQVRHDLMTTAGLVVLHNSATRVRQRGREVIGQFERCYLREKGRGLPPGIVILKLAA